MIDLLYSKKAPQAFLLAVGVTIGVALPLVAASLHQPCPPEAILCGAWVAVLGYAASDFVYERRILGRYALMFGLTIGRWESNAAFRKRAVAFLSNPPMGARRGSTRVTDAN